MGYELDSIQDNCYPDTSTLINKLDITDQDTLDEIEQTLTSINFVDAITSIPFTNVDFDFYKLLHHKLFFELYDWAGQVRTINISKKGTNFCDAKEINNQGNSIFNFLKKNNYYQNCCKEEFITNMVDLYCNINYLHPFREGNGRTQRLFLTMLINNAGYSIHFGKMDLDELMIATIYSSQGNIDLLYNILNDNIIHE